MLRSGGERGRGVCPGQHGRSVARLDLAEVALCNTDVESRSEVPNNVERSGKGDAGIGEPYEVNRHHRAVEPMPIELAANFEQLELLSPCAVPQLMRLDVHWLGVPGWRNSSPSCISLRMRVTVTLCKSALSRASGSTSLRSQSGALRSSASALNNRASIDRRVSRSMELLVCYSRSGTRVGTRFSDTPDVSSRGLQTVRTAFPAEHRRRFDRPACTREVAHYT